MLTDLLVPGTLYFLAACTYIGLIVGEILAEKVSSASAVIDGARTELEDDRSGLL